jgi:hypothetical protein
VWQTMMIQEDEETRSAYDLQLGMEIAFVMPAGWLVVEGVSGLEYRCMMLGCKQPVFWKNGRFWHLPGATCTRDPSVMLALEYANSVTRGLWYIMKCSECTSGFFPHLLKCVAAGVRVCRTRTVPTYSKWRNGTGDSAQLYSAVAHVREFGHATPATLLSVLPSLGLAVSIAQYGMDDKGRYTRGTRANPVQCYSTRMYVCCVSCMAVRMEHASSMRGAHFSTKVVISVPTVSFRDMLSMMMLTPKKEQTKKNALVLLKKPRSD